MFYLYFPVERLKDFGLVFDFVGGTFAVNILQECYGSFRTHTQQTHLHLLGGLQPARLHWLLQRTSPERMLLCSRHSIRLFLCLAKENRFRWKEQPGPVIPDQTAQPYWWQRTEPGRTEVSSRQPGCLGAGKNTWIFQARFLKPLERNIYISNQNISGSFEKSCGPVSTSTPSQTGPLKCCFMNELKVVVLNLFWCLRYSLVLQSCVSINNSMVQSMSDSSDISFTGHGWSVQGNITDFKEI